MRAAGSHLSTRSATTPEAVGSDGLQPRAAASAFSGRHAELVQRAGVDPPRPELAVLNLGPGFTAIQTPGAYCPLRCLKTRCHWGFFDCGDGIGADGHGVYRHGITPQWQRVLGHSGLDALAGPCDNSADPAERTSESPHERRARPPWRSTVAGLCCSRFAEGPTAGAVVMGRRRVDLRSRSEALRL